MRSGNAMVAVVLVLIIMSVAWRGTASQGRPNNARLESLLQQRYETLREAHAVGVANSRTGAITLNSLQRQRIRQSLLEAELEITNDKAKRIAVHQQYVKDVTEFWELQLARHKFGTASSTDVLEAKAKRLKAEIQLAREEAED